MKKLFAKNLVEVPPFVHLLVAGVTATAGLLATGTLIDNSTEKLVTGLASIWIPLSYILLVGIMHLAHARTTAARIMNGQPTTRQLVP